MRIVFILLIALAAWYGWKKWPELSRKSPSHEAVIQNASGMTMERIRLTVDGRTLVKEELPNEASATLPFKVAHDANIQLEWRWKEKLGELAWRGGQVPRGPMVQRHFLQVDADGGVVYTARVK